jgi:hypothetical protein
MSNLYINTINMNNENYEMFIENCKIKIFVILLNCKSMMTYIVSSLSSDFLKSYDDCGTVIIESININDNTDNVFYIFGNKYEAKTDIIKNEIKKIQYLSYRNHFKIPLKNGLVSDAGWGCMARTGQMMLCHTLKKIIQNDDEILSMFYDQPESAFSIHKITEYGANHHIPVGKWFNPTGIGYTLKDLVSKSAITNQSLEVVIGRDGSIFESEIYFELSKNKKVLMLIPVMLGLDTINKDCYHSVLKCFELESSVGIVGGKPRQSFYFVGKSNENVFFLDPHIVKPALLSKETCNDRKDDDIIRYIDISDLDPCMLLCFFVSSFDEYAAWKNDVNLKINSNPNYVIFNILSKEQEYANNLKCDFENCDDDGIEDGWTSI